MPYSYKKSEIQKFCQNQVLAKSSSFEKRVIKECYGHIVQRISESGYFFLISYESYEIRILYLHFVYFIEYGKEYNSLLPIGNFMSFHDK